MDDLVSESSNVVGVSSTGENKGRRSNAPIHCLSCLDLHCPLLVLTFNALILFSLLCLLNDTGLSCTDFGSRGSLAAQNKRRLIKKTLGSINERKHEV